MRSTSSTGAGAVLSHMVQLMVTWNEAECFDLKLFIITPATVQQLLVWIPSLCHDPNSAVFVA
jgi:hypothetical protein